MPDASRSSRSAPADDPVAKAVSGLRTRGYAVVENLAHDAAMDSLANELSSHFRGVTFSSSANRTKRIHSRVLADSPVLQAHLVAPVITGVLDQLLGPNCVKYQISSIQGIEVHPGAVDQSLHRDDDIFRLPHPHPIFEVSVMWAITEFTEDNGATRLIAYSHDWPSGRAPTDEQTCVAAMSKGSALLWLGSTWHGAGANRSDAPRIGLYAGYSLGWLRQEETLYLALPPERVRSMPEPLQRLIGYEIKGSSTLGWLDGRDPRAVLGL